MPFASLARELADTLEKVKPSVVAVGTVQRTRRPPTLFRGTGFVVGDGRYVITNAHVLPDSLDQAHKEQLAVFSGRGRNAKVHAVQVPIGKPVKAYSLPSRTMLE